MAETVNLTFVDQSAAPIPFVLYKIFDGNLMVSADARSDSAGTGSHFLEEGSYRITAGKGGKVKFDPYTFDVVDTSGPYNITLTGLELTTKWLAIEDLERAAGVDTVDQIFNDSTLGVRDAALLFTVMQAAESEAEAHMLRGYDQGQVANLASRDEVFRTHAAWVALEFATERRPEFIGEDGKGRYWAQYDRATRHFDLLSKSNTKSRGEEAQGGSGQNTNTGGVRRPRLSPGQSAHIFADEGNGSKHGGF